MSQSREAGCITYKGGDRLDTGDKAPESVEAVFARYGNMLYRTAFVMMKNQYDAEDAVQDTLIKYMERRKAFEGEEHRKAWLLRVTINGCKNRLRFYRNHPDVSMEELSSYYEKHEEMEVMEQLLQLPGKYREVLMLHYVEGYQSSEIAGLLKITEAAVRKRLERGRRQLKEKVGGGTDG